jgi:hypothetical protein
MNRNNTTEELAVHCTILFKARVAYPDSAQSTSEGMENASQNASSRQGGKGIEP